MKAALLGGLWAAAALLQTRDERVAAWREALELDRAEEVLADGPTLVGSGGALERDGEALAVVARALAQRGREDEAQRLLEAAKPEAHSLGFVELERARMALLDDRLEAARALLGEGSTDTPRFPALPDSWLLLARVHVRAGTPARAVPLLSRYLELAPLGVEAPSAWHMLAQEALGRGDAAAGERYLAAASQAGVWQGYLRARRIQIREQPDEPLPRLGLAQLWLQAGEPGRARSVLLELIALDPAYCTAFEALSEAERKLGNLPAAREALDRALACDAKLARARYNRALLARDLGDKAAARTDLETLLARPGPTPPEPWRVEAHLELARLLLAASEVSAAEERYAQYKALGGTQPLK